MQVLYLCVCESPCVCVCSPSSTSLTATVRKLRRMHAHGTTLRAPASNMLALLWII